MQLQHQEKPKNRGGKGFYLALGVCLIAVGVASWTTYESVTGFLEPTASAPEPVQNVVSGVTVPREDSSAPEPAPESTPESSPESSVNSSTGSAAEPAAGSAAEPEAGSAAETPAGDPGGAAEPAQETMLPALPEESAQPDAGPETWPEPDEWVRPVDGAVSKNFSGGDPIYSETMQDWRAHDGVDLEAAVGEAVRAMADGEVLRCYEDPLLGHTVEIAHGGGVTARYCGLGETFLVREGDAVAAGQEIGSVYQVPCECAERSHLHLELERNGSLFDPLL